MQLKPWERNGLDQMARISMFSGATWTNFPSYNSNFPRTPVWDMAIDALNNIRLGLPEQEFRNMMELIGLRIQPPMV